MENLFIHLRTHSTYSLLQGSLRVERMGEMCREARQPALALADSNNMFCALEFSEQLATAGIQPIIGCTFNLEDESLLVLLVKDEEGYQNLMKLSSLAYERAKPHIYEKELEVYHRGLICLSGGNRGILDSRLVSNRETEAEDKLVKLKGLFGDRFYLEIQRHGLAEQEKCEQWLCAAAQKHQLPLVATNDVHFLKKEDFESHDALLCIAESRKLDDDFQRYITPEHYFKSGEEMINLFSDLPEAIENSVEIARRCSFFPQEQEAVLPRWALDEDEAITLKKLAQQGLEERLAHLEKQQALVGERQDYQARLDRELKMISDMGFAGYFLIVADFVQWALKQDIPVGPGRGSGAGSLVAYALKITDLDPLRFGLIFERFLNPARVSMPDFDIDFCQERRDEVFHYVRERYGNDRVANIITFGKLQARAVVRDVGRVLGMPYGQVDRLAKLIPNNPSHPVTLGQAIEGEPALQEARQEEEQVAKLLDISLRLEGLNRHVSTHAAGIVIGNRPLNELIPIAKDQTGTTITQFSMKWAEKAGLVKFDFLGLKTLTALKRARDLLAERGESIDLSTIALDDEPTYALLTSGETGGIFQMESSGMRDVLRQVEPNRIEDLIALVSLYRPGPMENIPQYVRRKKGDEAPDYLHPMLEPVLKETFGVVIYQEQVMQIARVLAGYSSAEADLLRRAMGKKIRKEMNEHRSRFVKGAEQKGVEKKKAQHIFELVERFAGYGFNKSHAAAYALLAYQTAWLKTHYPTEFLAALMTLDMHNTDKLARFKQEAQRLGIKIKPPNINYSDALFSVREGSILHALAAVRDVGVEAARGIVAARTELGSFADIFAFAQACGDKGLNKRALESLAQTGAFDSIHANRRQLVEHAPIIMSVARQSQEKSQDSLFAGDSGGDSTLPQCEDWSMEEKLANEFKASGMYLSDHPLTAWQEKLEGLGIISFAEFEESKKSRGRLAGVITDIQERRSRKGAAYAFVRLSDLSGSYEVVIFTETFRATRHFLENGLLVVVEVEADRGGAGSGEGTRLRAQSLKRFDKDYRAKVQRKQMCLRLFIKQLDKLPDIKKELLANPGGTRVHLVLENGAEISLPDGVAFNQELADRFAALGATISD